MWLQTNTRKARKKYEPKNTRISYVDLVKRNLNPKENNVVAVMFLTYLQKLNKIMYIYQLQFAIKLRWWVLISSNKNNNQLVISSFNKLKRTKEFIMCFDHGSQYSFEYLKNKSKIKYIVSIGEVSNSLDNREVEYFFGCIKGEYLKNIKRWNMSIEKINKHIEWYNTKKIALKSINLS